MAEMSLPGTSSTQNEGDAVSGQDPRQAGEVRVTVRTFLKNTLIQLSLKNTHKKRNETKLHNQVKITRNAGYNYVKV